MAERAKRPVGPDPLGVELEQGADGVADLPCLEAGQAVGDHLREHRDDAVGQVDARAALPRGPVERRAGADEVGDVGDVDAEAPVAPLVASQGDGVVEVAGVGRVDGDGQDVAQVEPVAEVVLGEAPGPPPGLVERLVVERVGDVEGADDRQGVDARLAARAEHLGDHPLAVAARGSGSGPSRGRPCRRAWPPWPRGRRRRPGRGRPCRRPGRSPRPPRSK